MSGLVRMLGLLLSLGCSLSAQAFQLMDLAEQESFEITSNLSAESNSVNSAVSVMTQIADNVRFYGKVGLHLWDRSVHSLLQLSDQMPSDVDDLDKDMFLGFGGDVHVNRRVSLGGELSRYQLDAQDITLVSVNAAYHF